MGKSWKKLGLKLKKYEKSFNKLKIEEKKNVEKKLEKSWKRVGKCWKNVGKSWEKNWEKVGKKLKNFSAHHPYQMSEGSRVSEVTICVQILQGASKKCPIATLA